MITTPEDRRKEQEQTIKDTDWYKDEFGLHMMDKGEQKKKKECAAPEALYDLND